MFVLFGAFLVQSGASDFIVRLAKAAATGDTGPEVLAGESTTILGLSQRIGAVGLVELWEEANKLFERTDAVNLDRRHAIMSMFYKIETAARAAPSAA